MKGGCQANRDGNFRDDVSVAVGRDDDSSSGAVRTAVYDLTLGSRARRRLQDLQRTPYKKHADSSDF